MSKEPAAIRVRDLAKSYHLGRTTLEVLRGVTFTIQAGRFVSIVGASGSGKSTLLHLVGLLDTADAGEIQLAGQDVARFSAGAATAPRAVEVGFIFQFYHLLSELNVLENVLVPAQIDCGILGWPARRRAARKRAEDLLKELGLAKRARHKPSELSGGERQRVAIARALINEPAVLLADEPTGNLDSKTGSRIMDVLTRFNQRGQTILMVTHDKDLAARTDRTLHLRDGRLE